MTVRELMEMLASMPADAVVVFPDTYAESEGWGDTDPYMEVDGVVMDGARVCLTGTECEE